MRKLILAWFVASLIVTGGLYAYIQLRPQESHIATRSIEANKGGGAQDVTATGKGSTEQFALTLSIASSIISAAAALMQTWLTHRALKSGH
jgi:hypothetical protein